jgi:hypothetical protein
MLVIKEEKYPIKVGVEVYNVDYPSFQQAQEIAKEFNKIGSDGEKAIKAMKKWLMDLGLDKKFFDLPIIKSHHILKIWGDINTVKK